VQAQRLTRARDGLLIELQLVQVRLLFEVGIVEFSGVAMEWAPGAFEAWGSGVLDSKEFIDYLVLDGCNDELGNGECEVEGRPWMSIEPIATEEQAFACGEVAVAGCNPGDPLVL